jgi:hypothetical protein
MLTVLARLTLRKEKKKKNLLSYFRGSVELHTLKHSRTDQIKFIVSQPNVVSEIVEAYARGERKPQTREDNHKCV